MKFLKKIFKRIIILVVLIIGILYNKGVDAQALKYTINFIGTFENSKYNNDNDINGTISIAFELPFNQITVYNIGGIKYEYSINITKINSTNNYSHSVLKGPSLDIYEQDYIGQFSVPLGIKDKITTLNTFNGYGRTSMNDIQVSDDNSIEAAYVINNLLNDTNSYEYELFNVILYLKSENITPMAIAALKYNSLTISNDTSNEDTYNNSTSPNSSSLNPGGIKEDADSSKSSIDKYHPTITFFIIFILSIILLL